MAFIGQMTDAGLNFIYFILENSLYHLLEAFLEHRSAAIAHQKKSF